MDVVDVSELEEQRRTITRDKTTRAVKRSARAAQRMQLRGFAFASAVLFIAVIVILSLYAAKGGARAYPGGAAASDGRPSTTTRGTAHAGAQIPAASPLPSSAPNLVHLEVQSSAVALNSVGFVAPSEHMVAAVAAGQCGGAWGLIRMADERIIARGSTRASMARESDAPAVCIARFGLESVRVAGEAITPGTYRLAVLGVGASAPFSIGPAVYASALVSALGALHLERCGVRVGPLEGDGSPRRAGDGTPFAHGACHAAPDDDAARGGGARDVAGGWHDNGAYEKSSVGAALTSALLLLSWERDRTGLGGVRIGAPARALPALPAVLDEARWGLRWLLKMQDADGRVRHAVARGAPAPPTRLDADGARGRVSAWSVPATATFVAAAALGARALTGLDDSLASELRVASNASYGALLAAHGGDGGADGGAWGSAHGWEAATPELDPATARHLARTHAERRLQSLGARLWAAVELANTSGDVSALRDAEALIARIGDARARVLAEGGAAARPAAVGWQALAPIALARYLLLAPAPRQPDLRQPAVVERVALTFRVRASRATAPHATAHSSTAGTRARDLRADDERLPRCRTARPGSALRRSSLPS